MGWSFEDKIWIFFLFYRNNFKKEKDSLTKDINAFIE